MKNRKLTLLILQASIISMLGLSPAFADSSYSDDYTTLTTTGCTNNATCTASGFTGGFSGAVQALLFQPSYNQDKTMAAGSVLSMILTPPAAISLSSKSKDSKSVLSLISNKGNVGDNFLATVPQIFAPGIVLSPNAVPINIPFIKSLPFFNFATKPTEADEQSALNTLNFESVIAPMGYQKVTVGPGSDGKNVVDQQMVANTFIQYVTGLANPMRAADFSATKLPPDGKYTSIPAYLVDLQKKPEVRDYLIALRNYTTQLSVGISNFYFLHRERMPITNPAVLAQALAIAGQPASGSFTPPVPVGPLSSLQIQQFLATRRVSDPNWYTAMQNALPSTLLRESLFLLAEIPPMLFQLHLDLERILATMSAMQIQQASGNRLLLEGQRDKVDKILQSPEQAQSESQQAADQATQQASNEELEAAKQAVSDSQ